MQALWMIVASFSFACMGVCVKLAAAAFSAPEIVFYRSAISLFLMFVIVRLQGVRLATPHWRFQLLRGVSGFISLLLYFYAIVLLPLATAVTLNYTSPLFLALLLVWLGGQRLRRGMLGALLLGFVGVVLLLQPTLRADQLAGGLIGLGSGLMAGLAYYNVRELGARGETEARTVFYFSLLSTVGSALWMGAHEFHAVDARGALLLFGVAAFATLAQLAMTRAYKRGQTLVAASLAYSTVIFASLFGALLWGERLSAGAWLAIALIVASGIAATRLVRAGPAAQD
ncbi:MAG: DMT family transporter [Proteobacteria bacterium]|nr:DMT family transporter [Pseudomonadota bacterium]